MKHRLCFAALLATALAWPAAPALAAVIITAQEVGGDVVFQGSGTLNTTGLTGPVLTFFSTGSIEPIQPSLSVGNGSFDQYRHYVGWVKRPPGVVDGGSSANRTDC